MIERIDHAAIVVSDMQKSVEFYTKVLGFTYVRDLDFGDRELVYLALGEEPAAKIELLRYDATDHSKKVPEERTLLGLRHLALHVSGIEDVYNAVKAKGMEMLPDPPFMRENGPKIAFGKDPDGVLIEFTEI